MSPNLGSSIIPSPKKMNNTVESLVWFSVGSIQFGSQTLGVLNICGVGLYQFG